MTVEARRMLWRCRRGLLELDIVLAEFVQQHFDDLGSTQLEALDALLDMPDNQLWDMVTGREPGGDPQIRAMLELLRSTRLQAAQSI